MSTWHDIVEGKETGTSFVDGQSHMSQEMQKPSILAFFSFLGCEGTMRRACENIGGVKVNTGDVAYIGEI